MKVGPSSFYEPLRQPSGDPSSPFATCDSATQALSPSDLISSSQQEKEIFLCPSAEETQRWQPLRKEGLYGAEPTRDQCIRSNSEITMLFVNA